MDNLLEVHSYLGIICQVPDLGTTCYAGRWRIAVIGGRSHAKEQQYRRLVDECLTSANKIESRDTRGLLFRMAEAWLRLADEERAIRMGQIPAE